MILLIDNYDSFTYNLLNYLRQLQPNTHLIRNDAVDIALIKQWNPSAFVFSPGPQQPKDHPLMYEILNSFHKEKPILGICLGFQAIAEFSGAIIKKGPKPVHGKTSNINHKEHPAFQGIPATFQVARYHSLIIEVKPSSEGLKILAWDKKDHIPMAMAHQKHPLWGFQFHPEAILTEYGLKLFQNWLNYYNLIDKTSRAFP